jgi:hypothetical protein
MTWDRTATQDRVREQSRTKLNVLAAGAEIGEKS